ncbi:site-2 protease family protein, partial [Candidatus Woesearchaeota archaeon]|nr:site-2 protease family protein [Candidatus Woesearchaeota archaeon]
ILASNPTTPEKPFLGIKEIRNEYKIKEKYNAGWFKLAYVLVEWFAGFWKWLFLLSVGIGMFNLLPLPIVDGGRMAQVALKSIKGEEKGEKRYKQLSAFFLLILLLNLVGPFIIKLLW